MSASSDRPRLSSEDQQRVESVIHRGVNSIERKPFRPWLLLVIILGVLSVMSGLSYWIAWQHGVI